MYNIDDCNLDAMDINMKKKGVFQSLRSGRLQEEVMFDWRFEEWVEFGERKSMPGGRKSCEEGQLRTLLALSMKCEVIEVEG